MTIWAAVVGASGTGKTPGIDVTKRALTFIDRTRKAEIAKLALEHQTRSEAAGAERKLWKKLVEGAAAENRPAPPMPASAADAGEFVPPKLYVSDSTIERLAVLLQANPRGILRLSDELSALFLNMSRYSGGQDNEFWLEAWNGNSYLVERIGRPPITVEHLLVGVVGGLQPDKLSRSFIGDQDGMYARICFTWPSEPPYRPFTDDTAEIEPEVINALLRLIKLPCDGDAFGKMVPLSAAARERFEQLRQFLHARRDALDGREREWWSKIQANVLRLSGTLCFLDWSIKDDGSPEPRCVDEVFVSAAARLACEYFWPHSRAALRQIGLSERHANLRRALRWIKATGTTEVSVRDIRRDAMAGSLDSDATLDLIDRLTNSGWLCPQPVKSSGPKGGKPARRWQVNPLLWAAETAQTAETHDERAAAARRTWNRAGNAVKRSRRSTIEPRPLWQRVLAGERLPKRLFRQPKCEGTVEDHRMIALDVRELIRLRVFEQPVGRISNLDLTFPWLRVMRLNSSSLELQLVTGRTVVVPLVAARCGIIGKRLRLECPLCGRRVCTIYHLDGRVACRRCNGLWYAAERTSGYGRKFLAKQKVRRKLGDYGQLWAVKYPPKPRGMWRRTYARHCAALDHIESTKLTSRRMSANAPRAAAKRTFRNRREGPCMDGARGARGI